MQSLPKWIIIIIINPLVVVILVALNLLEKSLIFITKNTKNMHYLRNILYLNVVKFVYLRPQCK